MRIERTRDKDGRLSRVARLFAMHRGGGEQGETRKCKYMGKTWNLSSGEQRKWWFRDKPRAIIGCVNVRPKKFVKSTFVRDVEKHR